VLLILRLLAAATSRARSCSCSAPNRPAKGAKKRQRISRFPLQNLGVLGALGALGGSPLTRRHRGGQPEDRKSLAAARLPDENRLTMKLRATAITGLFAISLFAFACEQTPAEPESTKTKAEPVNVPTVVATVKPTPKMAAPPQAPQPSAIPAPDDVALAPKDAKKTASGLYTKVLTKGTGKERPKLDDRVKVDYTGWTKDGKMFDSSVARHEPATFGVGGVIKGWTEALQLMVAGEKRRLWIPADLAYGDQARMGTPSGQLTFDVELLEIMKAPKPWPVPADVKAAPKSAKKTDSGLVYKLLVKGKGKTHPGPRDRVTVHYAGWTPDGKQFDSSVTRGEPAKFSVGGVIKGWTEGLELMVEGDKMRLWIPADLAYGDKPTRPGAPAGPLVFDVELIAINGGAP
jgi:FKBP-type peptidyl-prolyl cis-trans isomerase